MTKISLLTLALFSVAAPSFAQNFAQDNEPPRIAAADMRCDINDERRLRWEAMDQEVILRTKLTTGPHGGLPRGDLSLILENGTQIDLGGGGKYYDLAPQELTNCQEHLTAAIGETVGSLEGGVYHPHLTLKSLMEEITYGKDCVDAQGTPKEADETASNKCQLANSLYERFAEEQPNSGLSEQDLIALQEADAPLITIVRSTYYSETGVYDARSHKIHILYYEGC